MEIKNKIDIYVNSDCLLEKAALLREIKTKTNMCYIDLEGYLYDERRTLIRINSINSLIPEILDLLRTNVITKIIAYELTNLSADDQFEYYLLIYELSELKKVGARRSKQQKVDISTFKPSPTHQFHSAGRLSGKDFVFIKQSFYEKESIAME